MLSTIRIGLFAFIAAILVACGGGGDGGGDTTPSFAGNYSISANLTSNSCAGSPATTLNGGDTVVQNGRNISIQSGELALSGTVDADNGGFTVNGSMVVNGVNAQAKVTFRTTATGGVYTFQETVGVNGCSGVYTGTARKV
jgi:hypothetical protein